MPKVPGIKVQEIKEGKISGKHPEYSIGTDVFPPHEFSMLVIAPRGSGKTTLILNFLTDFMKGYFHRVIVFSPTMAGDSKWEAVKRMRGVLAQNKNKHGAQGGKGGKAPKNIESESESESDEEQTEQDQKITFENSFHSLFGKVSFARVQVGDKGYQLQKKTAEGKKGNGRLRKKDLYSHYDETDLQAVMDEAMKEIKGYKKQGKSKHSADRRLLIFDDLVGSSLFSGKKDNPFRRLNTTMRHYSISAMMVSQAYKEVPKTVRVNATGVILFSIDNQAELESLYEENTVGLTKEQWFSIYRECTREPYHFMYINYARPKGERLFHNFDTPIKTPQVVEDTGETLRAAAATKGGGDAKEWKTAQPQDDPGPSRTVT